MELSTSLGPVSYGVTVLYGSVYGEKVARNHDCRPDRVRLVRLGESRDVKHESDLMAELQGPGGESTARKLDTNEVHHP